MILRYPGKLSFQHSRRVKIGCNTPTKSAKFSTRSQRGVYEVNVFAYDEEAKSKGE